MFPIAEVSAVQAAFPCDVKKMMPKWEEIPEEFKDGKTKWNKLFSDIFFCGVTKLEMEPRKDVDTTKAFRHIKAVMSSFEPQHEHKEAAVAFLMNEWFTDAIWERAERK